MRASRQTELQREFPLHVVCSWHGNSPRLAQQSYLLVTEDDFNVFSQVDSARRKIRRTALRQTKSVRGTPTVPITMQTGNRYEGGRGKKTNISNKLGISKTTTQARMRTDNAMCQLMLVLPSIKLMNFNGWFLALRFNVTQVDQSVKVCGRLLA